VANAAVSSETLSQSCWGGGGLRHWLLTG